MGAKETGEPFAADMLLKERISRLSAVEEETSVSMDETIWKELPDELLESVTARVPLDTFIRFRLVCHKWNSLPYLQRRVQQELPLIYAGVSNGEIKSGVLYDTLVKKWYYNTHTKPYYHWAGGPRCDSGGGLLCYADGRNASFHVGNPLTRTWKVFPWSVSTSLAKWGAAMAFVYNPSGDGGYKIIWLDLKGKYGVLDYSSSEDKTTITQGRIPANFERHCGMERKGLAIGSVVYFRFSNPEGIMSYDVVSGTWEEVLIAYPPNSHIFSLAESGGRLLLVGWVDYNKDNADADGIRPCVCVWELDTEMRSWIEVDRMPTSYCPVFKNHSSVNAMCLSTRRLLVILVIVWLFEDRTARRVQEIFAYDVVSREWSKVPEPECILPGSPWPQEVWCGLSFFPCLSYTLFSCPLNLLLTSSTHAS